MGLMKNARKGRENRAVVFIEEKSDVTDLILESRALAAGWRCHCPGGKAELRSSRLYKHGGRTYRELEAIPVSYLMKFKNNTLKGN